MPLPVGSRFPARPKPFGTSAESATAPKLRVRPYGAGANVALNTLPGPGVTRLRAVVANSQFRRGGMVYLPENFDAPLNEN